MAVDKIIDALASFLPPSSALHEPNFSGNELKYVSECVETGWVSSVGSYVDRFEQDLAAYTGARRAIVVGNGTAALHMCLLLAGVEREDEVLMPTFTFVATPNAVSYCGAISHFVDSDMHTLGIDVEKLRSYLAETAEIRGKDCFNKKTNRRIRAIVPMHTYGHSVDMDALVSLADEYQLSLIEDAAESIGSFYKGRHTGNFGQSASLSFNGNKCITTGGGGAILTNDEALAERAKHLTTTAKKRHAWNFEHDEVAYNYRLPNLNAALGCAQLEQLPKFIQQKRKLAMQYKELFSSIDEVDFFEEAEFAQSNYWLNVILLKQADRELRDKILETTNAKGFMTRPAWVLMHKLKMFADCPKMDLNCAKSLEDRIICLPSSPALAK